MRVRHNGGRSDVWHVGRRSEGNFHWALGNHLATMSVADRRAKNR